MMLEVVSDFSGVVSARETVLLFSFMRHAVLVDEGRANGRHFALIYVIYIYIYL
jgi:phosphate starvation-inducible membrane PsiE